MIDNALPLGPQLLTEMHPNPPLPLAQLSRTTSDAIGTVNIDRSKWQTHMIPDDDWVATPGLYVFWWKVNDEVSLPEEDAEHYVKGKKAGKHDPKPLPNGVEARPAANGKSKHIFYRTKWKFPRYDIFDGTYIPLYAGKANNIFDRVRQHLSWHQKGIDHYRSTGTEFDRVPITKFTTFQQFSAAFHYLFRNHPEMAQRAKLDHVCLSVQRTEFADFEQRFYREDLLIGYFRPPFNMDSER